MQSSSFLKKLKPIAIGSAMADMAMLLLIFFMATTTTEPPKGVDVDLPIAQSQGTEQDSIYITIGKKGRIYIDGEQVTLAQLGDILVTRQGEKSNPVALSADKNLDYKIVKSVLSVLQNHDFLNFVFMSQAREGDI